MNIPDMLKSKPERPFPAIMKAVILIVGLGLVSYSIKTFFTFDMKQLARTFPYALMGMACIFIAGFEKGVSLSSSGVAKTYRAWGTSGEKFIPWSDVDKILAKGYSSSVKVTFRTKNQKVNAEFTDLSPEDLANIVNAMSPGTKVELV